MSKENSTRVIVSGGGTGGHIFPAISIANALRREEPNCEILFVGAQGRMEMERVPQAGYQIIGLKIAGLKRSLSLSNIKVAYLYLSSIYQAKKIIKEFKPHAAVGVGGYASAPLLKAASAMGVPYIIQEQNSYAGVTNKILAKRAEKICVAYEGMERFFPKEKILVTGNPVRESIKKATQQEKREAKEIFGFSPQTPILLVIGGSLGARTLNLAMQNWILENRSSNIGIIWQTGEWAYKEIEKFNRENPREFVKTFRFIGNMEQALAAADLVISRAGAGTISELAIAAKATIFVPSPNVAEDHQTSNAMALVERGAALMVKDSEASSQLMERAISLIAERDKIERLQDSIEKMALYNSDKLIAEELLKLCNNKKES